MIVGRLIKQLRASYSAKLIAIFIIALCLMATALNITSNQIQRTSYTDYMRASGLAMAQLLAKSVQLDVFTENRAQLRVPAASLLSQEDILQVEVLDRHGLPLITLGKTQNPDELPDRKAIVAAMADQALHFKEWPTSFSYCWPVEALATTGNEDELYFDAEAERLTENTPPLGYVTIIASKIQYEKNIRDMALRTGLIILALLVLLVAGVLLFIRRVAQPLRLLVHKIKTQRHIDIDHDDIGLLDTTITTLIHDLDHSFQTINDLTNSLEDKVAKRTRELALANEELTTRQTYLEEANANLERALQELQEAEGQLIQSEKMAAIGQVVAGVAHEINNNINFISGALPSMDRTIADIQRLTDTLSAACQEPTPEKTLHAKALQQELAVDSLFADLAQLMANIHEGANRTTRIVADLRTFSRADEQGYKAVDLHKSLDSTITFLDKDHLKHSEIIKKYGEIPLVSCLPDRINQVFLNIMNNALYAMAPEGGTLTIDSSCEDGQVHIRFSDTGSGIPKEVLPKIFDPFYTSKDIGEGSGIGLAISYKIIQQHGGRIRVTSEEGKGSSFEVILPSQQSKGNSPDKKNISTP
jgi:signal transduction histidine kinase